MGITFQKITNSPQKLISCRREEVEACATTMLSSEELFRTWCRRLEKGPDEAKKPGLHDTGAKAVLLCFCFPPRTREVGKAFCVHFLEATVRGRVWFDRQSTEWGQMCLHNWIYLPSTTEWPLGKWLGLSDSQFSHLWSGWINYTTVVPYIHISSTGRAIGKLVTLYIAIGSALLKSSM